MKVRLRGQTPLQNLLANPRFVKYRWTFVLLCHLAIIACSLTASFLLRFDLEVPRNYLTILFWSLCIALPLKAVVFHLGGLHHVWSRYVGMSDVFRVFGTNLLASGCLLIAAYPWMQPPIPRSIYVIDLLLCFLCTVAARFTVRIFWEMATLEQPASTIKDILIYGAGHAGATLAREVRSNPSLHYRVVGFLDDDPVKRKAVLMGVPVLGSGRDAARIVEQYRRRGSAIAEIVVAMPSATGRQMREALANCRAADVTCKTIPGISELLGGKVLSAQIRNLSVNDLLGRKPVLLDEARIRSAVAGRSILVTGAGGSIGSELCRQIAGFHPRRLVALDQAESDLFRIDLELRQAFPSLELTAQIADIRDQTHVDDLVRRLSFDSIFHAAAYKHVPMMETHPVEAAETNVLGTWHLVQSAVRHRVSSFLMVSSDKAVNPESVMGLTKRAAEMIVGSVRAESVDSGTKFASVRFGNVLGSNGSVVPVFQQQIAAGGPVTVTHPDVRRFFMTTREAVQLILQASTMGNQSEVFVLDMGEPIRIVDLARNMIRLSGLEPDEDIEIRYIGLRPGEKLFEEVIAAAENTLPTHHEKIKIFQSAWPERQFMETWLRELRELGAHRDQSAVVAHLAKLVPEYRPSELWAGAPVAKASPPAPSESEGLFVVRSS